MAPRAYGWHFTVFSDDSYITLNARFFDLEWMDSQNANLALRIFNERHRHDEITNAISQILSEFELGSVIKSSSVTEKTEDEEDDMEAMCEGDGSFGVEVEDWM